MTRRKEITRESWKRYPNSPERNFGTGDYEYPEYHEAEREAFEAGVEWADKTMIEKACEWLKENIWVYINYEGCSGEEIENDVIEDFCKAMEE